MKTRIRRALTAFALGAGTLVAVIAVVEALIRAQIINPFVVPLPSAVGAAIPVVKTLREGLAGTTVNRVYHLDRGYEKIEEKLQCVGGQVERLK